LIGFFRGERFWPSAEPSAGPGGIEPCLGALPDDISFKLRQSAEDEFSSGCGGVNRLCDRFEADPAALKAGDRLDEVGEGPSKAVEAPDDQGVAFPKVAQGFIEACPFGFRTGRNVGKDAFTACFSKASF
jgi:hypothetical protein